MLNEVYAPTTVADLAWSRQKIVALSTLVRSTRSGAQNPRILLLYGPPGCGKLESLKVLLREAPPAAASTTSKSKTPAPAPQVIEPPTIVSVFHTCEASSTAYSQFLQHVLSLCSGQLVGSALTLTPRDMHGGRDTPSAPSDVQHAHIIKFYGEPATHVLHRATVAFLRQYEALRLQAIREEEQQQQQHQRRYLAKALASPASPSTTLMDHLRRNLIFFVHTTHDSHNDKVDLGSALPAAVLQSAAVELFHCTPVTEINLKKRLRHILDTEARRRANRSAQQRRADVAEATDVDDLFGIAPALSGSSAAPRRGAARGGVGSPRGKKGKQSAKHAPATALHIPDAADVLDSLALDAIAAGSQGDIRQALLQVQWAALVPPGTNTAASLVETAADSSDAVWARLQHRRALAQALASGSSKADESSLALSTKSVAPLAEACAAPQQQDSIVAEDDDGVVLLISSPSSSESDAPPSPSAAEVTRRQHPLSCSHEAATRKRSRSSENDVVDVDDVGTTSKAAPPSAQVRVTDMLSLLDSQMNGAGESRAAALASRGAAKKPLRSAPARRDGLAAKNNTDADDGAAVLPDHRTVLPTTRDEYLGLSHATGRLLSQKYSVDAVLDILNVPPRKMLDYLTNNQVRYFSDAQLPEYAVCAAAASEVDALRTAEFDGGYGGSAAALRERRQLADRTTAGESVGNVARLLDVIALQTFHRRYLVEQTAVQAPPGFTPQEPPPFLRSAYPRVRDVGSTTNATGPYVTQRGEAVLESLAGVSEHEWMEQFLLRLDSAANGSGAITSFSSSGRRRMPLAASVVSSDAIFSQPASGVTSPSIRLDEVDILREGLPDLLYRCGRTESVVMDHYALAPYIVLNLPASSQPSAAAVASQPSPTVTPAGISSAASGDSADAGGAPFSVARPRRTVFKFAALTPPPPPPTQPHSQPASLSLGESHAARLSARRPCTSLQLKILQRGRDSAAATLRGDYFMLVATENIAEEGSMSEKGGVEERPWMPEGDDIEDD